MSRTLRATLSAGSQLLQIGITLVVGLAVTPIILKFLGDSRYGVWLMIIQASSYLSLFDFGNATVLKHDLAAQQHVDAREQKRRQFGAALVGLAASSPIYVVFGVGLIFFLLKEVVAETLPASQGLWTLLLVLGSMLLGRMTACLNFLLFGVNLQHKSTTRFTFSALATAVFDVVVVSIGWGILGLAGSKLLGALVNLLITYQTVRAHVPWYGVRVPSKPEIFQLFRRNSIYLISQWGSILSEMVDVFLVGYLVAPATAAAYSLTLTLSRIAGNTLGPIITAGTPGFGDLFARQQYHAILTLRFAVMQLGLVCFGLAGSCILLVNQAFVAAWVGSNMFAGPAVTIGGVLLAATMVLNRFDKNLAMGALWVRESAWNNLAGGLISTLLAIFLLQRFGIAGMLVGLLAGRVYFFLSLSHLFSRKLKISNWHWLSRLIRPALSSGVLMGLSALVNLLLTSRSLFIVSAVALIWVAVFAPLLGMVGLHSDVRRECINRAVLLRDALRRRWFRPGQEAAA